MKCPKCETEINRLEKRFPWLDFVVSMFIALLFFLIPVIGWLLAAGIVVVWFAWYSWQHWWD